MTSSVSKSLTRSAGVLFVNQTEIIAAFRRLRLRRTLASVVAGIVLIF